jgi:hypothetical protein
LGGVDGGGPTAAPPTDKDELAAVPGPAEHNSPQTQVKLKP